MAELETLPDELRNLLSLEDAPGPALPVTEVALASTVAAAMKAASMPPSPSIAPRIGTTASVTSAVVVAGGVAAFLWLHSTPGDETPSSRLGKEVSVAAPATAEAPAMEVTTQDGARAAAVKVGDDLLHQANRLRGAGKYREAERVYVRVIQSAPHSEAAYVARVAAADLRRDRLNDAAGALEFYRAALAEHGALSAEALRGVAQSQRMLGHAREEREALETLLAAHPQDAAAAWARRRLAELGEAHAR